MSEPARLPVPVPTLAELQADPSTFDALPRQVQDAVYEQAAALEARLRSKILVRPRAGDERTPAEPDWAVAVEEAVGLLAMKTDYVYRHWAKLGGYKDDDGHVKFLMSTIPRHIRQQARR